MLLGTPCMSAYFLTSALKSKVAQQLENIMQFVNWLFDHSRMTFSKFMQSQSFWSGVEKQHTLLGPAVLHNVPVAEAFLLGTLTVWTHCANRLACPKRDLQPLPTSLQKLLGRILLSKGSSHHKSSFHPSFSWIFK